MLVMGCQYQRGCDVVMKLLVCPNENIKEVLAKDITGIIVGINDLATYPLYRVDLLELEELKKNTNKEIIVSVNKMMHNSDLEYLEKVLLRLKELDIKKILFYDMAVYEIAKRLDMVNRLVIYQEHLNTNIYSNKFYLEKGIECSFISSDITINEIKEIKRVTNINIMYTLYGYLPIYYSKRKIISNYLEYISKDKDSNKYYIKDKEDYYLVSENKEGSIIYTKEPVNLVNEINNLEDIDYGVIDLSYSDISKLDLFLNKEKVSNPYSGFYDIKTIYRVKKDE